MGEPVIHKLVLGTGPILFTSTQAFYRVHCQLPRRKEVRVPTADEFRTELFKMMHEAVKQGSPHVDINAGELHRRLGDYPGPNHRMPVCCEVMTRAMAEDTGDRILEQPASGRGASLTIRYILPRPA